MFYGSGMGKGYISLYSITSQPMAERSHGQNLEAGSMRETMRDHEGGLLFGSLPGFAQPVGFLAGGGTTYSDQGSSLLIINQNTP